MTTRRLENVVYYRRWSEPRRVRTNGKETATLLAVHSDIVQILFRLGVLYTNTCPSKSFEHLARIAHHPCCTVHTIVAWLYLYHLLNQTGDITL